jgi:hypothetical protein
VTALWSAKDRQNRDEPEDGLLAALLRAIDLRRLSPYHAPAPEGGARREETAPPGRVGRHGVWLPGPGGAPGRPPGLMRARLRLLLGIGDTPPRAALAFALGVFIACTPLLGLHALIALGLAFLLGLNRLAMLAGTFVNNPWTLVPIYTTAVSFGMVLLGVSPEPPSLEGLTTWTGAGEFLARCRPFLAPLLVGTLALGAAGAALSYPIILVGLRWYRSVRRSA